MELRTGGGTAVKRGAQLRPMQRAVRDHQYARGRCRRPRRRVGGRLPERSPSIRVLGGDLPEESADKRADEQRYADQWSQQRTERDGGADDHGTPHRDVKRVGFVANRISHLGSPLPLEVLLPAGWTVNAAPATPASGATPVP